MEEKTCVYCKETKRSPWMNISYYHIEGTHVVDAGDGGHDLYEHPDGFDDMKDQRVWKCYDICETCQTRRPAYSVSEEIILRERMVEWAIKFSKCQNITPRLVQEFKKLKEKSGRSEGRWTRDPWPIYFNDADEDMAWALWRQAMEQ
jgi:hypothetical protein